MDDVEIAEKMVSIHAPAGGATFLNPAFRMMLCFNPRARRGRDNLSITRNPSITSFNPRARRGRD